ncbi:helix-turn-helix domain-containing protein [Herbaspirillum sp. RV1423]|uniref:helix-turn-helix domain-containing protein n=1 Tax=Herbaspirillum sp. RV1423 TaxID=1443993 RepID=UPI0004AE7075|nr:helix-turn-helix transcriptional regulator [Herbaspirillum sp. RV1423]
MNIGQVLRKIRKERKASLEEIALVAGTDAANLSRVERDKQRLTPDMLENVAKALEVPVSSLYLIAEQNMQSGKSGNNAGTAAAARLESALGRFILLSARDQQLTVDFMELLLKSTRQ